jgi:hypothetical protein
VSGPDPSYHDEFEAWWGRYYTRMLFTQDLERAILDELGHGLARETYAQRQFFPIGGGMTPLDRPWDEEPWSD